MERTSRFFWSGVSSRSLRWQHGWACCTNATTVAAPPVTPVKPGPPTPTTGISLRGHRSSSSTCLLRFIWENGQGRVAQVQGKAPRAPSQPVQNEHARQATRPQATPKAWPLCGPPVNPNPGSTLPIVFVEVQVLIDPHLVHARKGGLAVHDPLLLFLGSRRLWLGCLGCTGGSGGEGG